MPRRDTLQWRELVGELAASVVRTQELLDELFVQQVHAAPRLPEEQFLSPETSAVRAHIQAALAPTRVRVNRSRVSCDLEVGRRRSVEGSIGCQPLQLGWSMRTGSTVATRSTISFSITAAPVIEGSTHSV